MLIRNPYLAYPLIYALKNHKDIISLLTKK